MPCNGLNNRENPRNGLSKGEIMRTASAIDTLFARGRRSSAALLRCVWRVSAVTSTETEAEGQMVEGVRSEADVCVLFSVPKKFFKRANKRNLLRRRMKESYRQSKHALVELAHTKGVHVDVALIYTSKEISDYNTINDAVGRILEQICERL